MLSNEKDYIIVFLTGIIVFGAGFLLYQQIDTKNVVDISGDAVIEVEEEADEDLENSTEASDDEKDTEDSEEASDMSAEDLIKHYYALIVDQDLEAAFALKKESDVSFETFEGWYEGTESASVKNFAEQDDGTYTYDVSMYSDSAGAEEFTVTVKIYGDEFTTLSSYRMTEEDEEEQEVSGLSLNEQDIELIKQYYKYIEGRDFDLAYSMKVNPGISLDTFSALYKDTYDISPHDFERVGQNTYTYQVVMHGETDPNERYNLKVKIKGDQLETLSSLRLSSKQIDETLSYSDSLKVQSTWTPEERTVTLIKNGRQVIVDTANIGKNYVASFTSFGDFEFLLDGRYLSYTTRGWEHYEKILYDVQNEKILVASLGHEFSFTDDAQYFYECSVSEMLPGGVNVYLVPSFDKIYSHTENNIKECSYFYPTTGAFAYKTYSDETVRLNVYDL